jgi:hypothetical protein
MYTRLLLVPSLLGGNPALPPVFTGGFFMGSSYRRTLGL